MDGKEAATTTQCPMPFAHLSPSRPASDPQIAVNSRSQDFTVRAERYGAYCPEVFIVVGGVPLGGHVHSLTLLSLPPKPSLAIWTKPTEKTSSA